MKYKFEIKYIVDFSTGLEFINQLRYYLRFDKHAKDQKEYEVRSLYFDTQDFQMYKAVEDGHPSRRKIRFRNYSIEDNFGFLESKNKFHGVINKQRVFLSVDEFKKIIQGYQVSNNKSELVADFSALFRMGIVKPTVGVIYKRLAFEDMLDGKNRVTLDFNIKCCDPESFFRKDANMLRVLPVGLAIIELKFYEQIPSWLNKAISNFQLNPTKYSKYVTSIDRFYNGKYLLDEFNL